MLFAWADDITTQNEIMTLDTQINDFYFPKRRAWLLPFTLSQTVFSSSENYTDGLERLPKSVIKVTRVYDGLDTKFNTQRGF